MGSFLKREETLYECRRHLFVAWNLCDDSLLYTVEWKPVQFSTIALRLYRLILDAVVYLQRDGVWFLCSYNCIATDGGKLNALRSMFISGNAGKQYLSCLSQFWPAAMCIVCNCSRTIYMFQSCYKTNKVKIQMAHRSNAACWPIIYYV